MSRGQDEDIPSVADVAVRGTRRPMILSYAIPEGMRVRVGEVVLVPFGTATREGLVVGPAENAALATRSIASAHGQAMSAADLAAWKALADAHAIGWLAGLERMVPGGARDAPLHAGEVLPGTYGIPVPETRNFRRRLYIHPPLLSAARLAAFEATRLADYGQVLVLCPTTRLVDEVARTLPGGAARMDGKARRGALAGFMAGTVRIGVGTRATSWLTGPALAGIVVVDEGHPGHRDMKAPYATNLEIAAARAAAAGIALTAISSNPTASGLGAKLKVIAVGSKSDWPGVAIVDATQEPPGDRMVPGPVRRALARASDKGMEAVGLAGRGQSVRLCRTCKTPVPCPSCGQPRCGCPVPACPQCASTESFLVGMDAQRVHDLLGIAGHTQAGMEALAPGSRLVVVPDADRHSQAPGLDPEHAAMSAILAAAAAAGKGGRLILVTGDPKSRVMAAVAARDQYGFARATWERARLLGLPPFRHVVFVRSAAKVNTSKWPGDVWGPRLRDGEYEVIVHAAAEDMAELRPVLRRLRDRGKARIRIT